MVRVRRGFFGVLLDLLAQTADDDVYRPIGWVVILADRVDQPVAGKHPVRGFGQGGQQVEFAGSKSLGLQLIDTLSMMIKGELSIGEPPGANFLIVFNGQRP